MRHGEAQDFVEQGSRDDSQRALTEHGKQEANIMATWLQKMNVKPSQVLVSPYVRAQQTCEIVTAYMQSNITTLDFITPSGDAKQVHDFIDGYLNEFKDKSSSNEHSILIVSHMPLVSYLVAELTQSENAPIFSTAGVAEIEYNAEAMKGQLVGIASPIDFY